MRSWGPAGGRGHRSGGAHGAGQHPPLLQPVLIGLNALLVGYGLVRATDLRHAAVVATGLAGGRGWLGCPRLVGRGDPPVRVAGRAIHGRPAQPRRAGGAPADVRRVRRADDRSVAHLRPVAHVPGLHRAAGQHHGHHRPAGRAGGGGLHPARRDPGGRGHGPPRVRCPRRGDRVVDAPRVHLDRVVRAAGRRAGDGPRPAPGGGLPGGAPQRGGPAAHAPGRRPGRHALPAPAGRRPDRGGHGGHGRARPRALWPGRRAGTRGRSHPRHSPGHDHGRDRHSFGPGPARRSAGARRRVAL